MATESTARTLISVVLPDGGLPQIVVDKSIQRLTALAVVAAAIYFIIGAIMAISYLSEPGGLDGAGTALVMLIAWPLKVLGINVDFNV